MPDEAPKLSPDRQEAHMTDHIRWGILGAADFAQKTMVPAINEAAHGRLVAIATRSPDKAVPFAAQAPGLRVHDSYDALLADPQVDAVYIPLPNTMHAEWSIKAVNAGKHVLSEKPIAMQAAEFDDLIAARDRTGKHLAEGWMPAFHPQWATIRDLIAAGDIGDLHTVTGAFSFGLHDAGNIRNKAGTGGGALRDIGVYPIGTFRFATGLDPAVVLADAVWDQGIDASAWVQARADDVRFGFHVSMRTTRQQAMVFEGTRGTIRVAAPFNPGVIGQADVTLLRDGHAETVLRFPSARQYVLQLEAFHAHVLDGAPYACPLEFSRGTQVMIDAVFAALGPPA